MIRKVTYGITCPNCSHTFEETVEVAVQGVDTAPAQVLCPQCNKETWLGSNILKTSVE